MLGMPVVQDGKALPEETTRSKDVPPQKLVAAGQSLKRLKDGRQKSDQLASPPVTPDLPAVSENDLRNGVRLDFVKQFRLEEVVEAAENGDQERNINGTQESRANRIDNAVVVPQDSSTGRHSSVQESKDKVLKLSPKRLFDLASSPESLPLQANFHSIEQEGSRSRNNAAVSRSRAKTTGKITDDLHLVDQDESPGERAQMASNSPFGLDETVPPLTLDGPASRMGRTRPYPGTRAYSSPLIERAGGSATKKKEGTNNARFRDLKIPSRTSTLEPPEASPMPKSIPVPPLSMSTYLQLELSAERPSPLYIHRSVTSDFPYESSRVKIERLKNFLLLPPQLERLLWFGALACLDAWLFSFTILPLRFVKAVALLAHSWSRNLGREARDILGFIYVGSGRMWERHRRGSNVSQQVASRPSETATSNATAHIDYSAQTPPRPLPKQRRPLLANHRRSKSTPSALLPDHKADILRGLLILLSCNILMYFDASRMYHGIRGQAAIKLYVIYNVLEVCDRLFSALGQDVLECLFSKETLERKADGRSKVLRPFWLFMLALGYNLVHSTALFYQVITLNVAVNSYSNALLTLLLSNQFVEIKSTVFKKFEKENLFQLTCADVVERFQLWLMLMIIASRNVVETGGLSLSFLASRPNSTSSPATSASILPRSFTLFPSWTGQVLAPFFLVLGSEMLVDWIKHAYITKFNNTKPAIYGRFLDILAKDYYSNAFADQNLTRRLGLPVVPLACLFIRASVQTYQMLLATYLPPPLPSTATSLSVESTTTSEATTEALAHVDNIVRRALYGPPDYSITSHPYQILDILLPYLLPLTAMLLLFLFLLLLKILLGMMLLSFARSRYKSLKEREGISTHGEGRRVGGWGVIEVDEDKRRWIYADDPDGAKRLREREARERDRIRHNTGDEFEKVERYSMMAKRIW